MFKRLPKDGKTLPVMVAERARDLVWAIGGPVGPSDNHKSVLARAAARLHWPLARTTNVFRRRARVITADEWIRLNQEAADQAQKLKKLREAQHELDRLAGRALERAAVAMGSEAPPAAHRLDATPVERPAEQGGQGPASVNR